MSECLSPEILASFASLPEAERDVALEHLAGCDLCRRHLALLAAAAPVAARRPSLAPVLASLAAAAVVAVCVALFLRLKPAPTALPVARPPAPAVAPSPAVRAPAPL